MFDYILAFVIWLGVSFIAAFALVNLNVWSIIVVFSLLAAVVTVAYGKLTEKLTNMERSIEELKEIVPETYVVGDANKTGLIGDATNSAYYACMSIDA